MPSSVGLPLDNSAEDDRGDRISLEEACALLDVPERTFRRQYLIAAKREVSTARFTIREDEAGRITVSRRLILEHRAEVIREIWGGAYGPSGRWADRIRLADEAVAAYEAWERRASTDDAVRGEAGPPDPQRDLFAE